MEVFLIRHTAVDVPAGYAYGQTDVPLKASFMEEAARVKQVLEGHTFDQVWSSPLSRCRRLATYCGYPEPMIDPRLMEVSFGEWEMKSWDDVSSDPRFCGVVCRLAQPAYTGRGVFFRSVSASVRLLGGFATKRIPEGVALCARWSVDSCPCLCG